MKLLSFDTGLLVVMYPQNLLISFTASNSTFSFLSHLSTQSRIYLQQAAVFSENILMNPVFSTCPPNDRPTTSGTSW